MRDTKYRFETLCIYDYRGVEEHLSAMAAQGWRLEKAGNSVWKYRRSEPGKVRYAVTYSATASQFNPGPTEGQRSLAELCEAAGWTKVCDWFQMQIFSTEDENAVPLETDEALRLENIHRSMRKNFLPVNIIVLIVGLLFSVSFLGTLIVKPVRIFERGVSLLTGQLFIMVTLLEIYTFWHYYGWRRRSRRSIEEGGPCAPIDTRAYQRLNWGGLVLTGVLTVLYLLSVLSAGNGDMALVYAVYTPCFFLIVFLIHRTTDLLRKLKVSKGWNMVGTLLADVALVALLTGGLVYGGLHFGWFSGGSGETYKYQNLEFDVHPREDVPLTLSDLTGENYRHVSRNWRSEGSFFVPQRSYREYVLENAEYEEKDAWPGSVWFSYTIYEPRGQWLCDALLEDQLEDDAVKSQGFTMFTRRYEPEDPAPWGAEAAYRRYVDDDPLNTWLLVWPGRIVGIGLDWPPTDREKDVIRERLAPEA